MKPTDFIDQHRLRINELDAKIVSLLNERAKEVFSIGKIKKENGMPVHDPSRESIVLQKIRNLQMKSSDTPLTKDEMVNIYFKIIDSFRSYEEVHNRASSALSENQNTTGIFQQNLKVVFWGFGLMGASFYLALQEYVPHWQFVACDPFLKMEDFNKWKMDRNANVEALLTHEIPECDILILGAPVKEIVKFIRSGQFTKSRIVIDLGSVKGPILAEVEEYFKTENKDNNKTESKVLFVGGHPLAGKEKSGYQFADATLFYNKVFILNQDFPEVSQLVKIIGAIPYVINAQTHDRTLAASSHLLQIISTSLAMQYSDSEIDQNLFLLPGFSRDVLRVSGSSFDMWEPILSENKKNILNELEKLLQGLMTFKNAIQNEQWSEIKKWFSRANSFYKKIQETKLF